MHIQLVIFRLGIFSGLVFLFSCKQNTDTLLHQSESYAVYHDRVVQGEFLAKALSDQEIVSNYQSPANNFQSASVIFKFSINSKDNEMLPGIDHQFVVRGKKSQTPVIIFGQQLKFAPAEPEEDLYLEPDTEWTVRVDMRPVLEAFEKDGFFQTYNGEKIYKDDFKGVYIAGPVAPMSWDFDNLANREGMQLLDEDGDGIFEQTFVLNAQKDKKTTDGRWVLSHDISTYPSFSSGAVLKNALHNMSLEEMIKAIEPDSTFRTGQEWAGVWTRDISYSIILSMAHLQPEVAKISLMRKVNERKRIVQDTGTGGAYPVSTDRMVWAIAAWEIYQYTGDEAWLRQSEEIIRLSLEDDLVNAYDEQWQLLKGESSFLDWREQTYPKWMQPADIFESFNLGTNAVHFQAHQVLAEMSKILGKSEQAKKHAEIAEKIKTGINTHLWMEDKGFYAQYIYGRMHKSLSPRAEALGEALCVIFGIADQERAERIVSSTPVLDFGIPCIYPQIPGIPPYHNNGIWPFVQAYWTLAAAKVKNEKAVVASMAALERAQALFVTNKENFVADNGDFAGTQVNSSNMLWSLAGSLAHVHKVIFGLQFKKDHLAIAPFLPAGMGDTLELNNIRFRDAVIAIKLYGYGDQIQKVLIDGQEVEKAEISAQEKGNKLVEIFLSGSFQKDQGFNLVANAFSIETPRLRLDKGQLIWDKIPGAVGYQVLKNGNVWAEESENILAINDGGEYQVIALSPNGYHSFASEPVYMHGEAGIQLVEMEDFAKASELKYQGYYGKGFVEISNALNREIKLPIAVAQEGWHYVTIRYANGNGPINTENKCAIRSLYVNKQRQGVLVFPQRGFGEWSSWGFSNGLKVYLEKGNNELKLVFEEENENMHGLTNQAMLDQLRINKIEK